LRFLVDECAGPSVAAWLRERGHDVFSVFEQARGAPDVWILDKAQREAWILLTVDKDFGEHVFRRGSGHRGIVLLRLQDERLTNKLRVLTELLLRHAHDLPDNYVVATETTVRIAKVP